MNYKLSNLSHKDSNFSLNNIIDVIRINDGSIFDFDLSVVPGKEIICGEKFNLQIKKQWEFLKDRATYYGKKLYNSNSFQIEDIDIKRKLITLSKNVDYKTIISTRSNEKNYNYSDWTPAPNAFVVVNILITKDNKIVLGKRDFYGDRPIHTYETPGAFSNYKDLELSTLSKITQSKISEDYDLDNIENIVQTIPFAIYHFPRILETIFLCVTRIDILADKLHAKKYSDILIMENNYEGIKNIIKMPVQEFHPPSRTVLQFFYKNYSVGNMLLSKMV